VQVVGSKTFVMRDGVWMDTAFDADTQTAQEVGFASDAYFELLTAVPELGQYLALGQQLLIVYEDQVYEIVAGEGAAEIVLPQIDGKGETAVAPPTNTNTANPDTEPVPLPFTEPDTDNSAQPTNQVTLWFVVAGGIVGVVLFAGWLAGKRP